MIVFSFIRLETFPNQFVQKTRKLHTVLLLLTTRLHHLPPS